VHPKGGFPVAGQVIFLQSYARQTRQALRQGVLKQMSSLNF